MSVPQVERLGMETVELRVTLAWVKAGEQAGGWREKQTFKRAYCCSFHSGFDCLCFDLVWGSHVVQCYPPVISAISETLQKKKNDTDCVSRALSTAWSIFSPLTVSMNHLISE